MHLRQIALEGYTVHKETALELPSQGLVVVTGPNGSGKSSLVEAVGTGFWGKTLRGEAPWDPAASQSRVLLLSDRVEVARVRKGDRTQLAWNLPGKEPTRYETATKAQEALSVLVGDFETWRRSSVFTSDDVLTFSRGTDATRKRFLEQALGLHRFDPAREQATADLKALTQTLNTLERARDSAQQSITFQQARIREAEERLASLGPVVDREPLDRARDRRSELLHQVMDEQRVLSTAIESCKQFIGMERGEMAAMGRRLEALKGRQACPTCDQSVLPAYLERLKASQLEAVAQHEARIREHEQKEQSARADWHDLQLEREALLKVSAEQNPKLDHLTQVEGWRRVDSARRESAVGELHRVTKSLEQTLAQLQDASARWRVVEASVSVLGLKGVRAAVLSRALGGLQALASAWLSRFSGLQLHLEPYTEKRDGALVEEISLRMSKPGEASRPYGSFSQGERRRGDVALVLGLAEVISASHGEAPGTLYMDEVFDTLDPEGLAAVSEAVTDLARERAVLVISHNPELVAHLPAARRVVMKDGRIS